MELEHLYAQLAAVEALIRALEIYRQYYPKLVPDKTQVGLITRAGFQFRVISDSFAASCA